MQEAKRSLRKQSSSRTDIGDMVILSCIKKQKTPQSLAGLMSYRYSLHLFNSKTCPAIGIIPIGTKPDLCLFMEHYVAHCCFFCSAKMVIIFRSHQIFAQLFFILYLNNRQTWESFFSITAKSALYEKSFSADGMLLSCPYSKGGAIIHLPGSGLCGAILYRPHGDLSSPRRHKEEQYRGSLW